MIKLVENYFRGKKKSVIAEELSAFCEEHGLQERDVKTIISKMYLPKRKKKIGLWKFYCHRYPPSN